MIFSSRLRFVTLPTVVATAAVWLAGCDKTSDDFISQCQRVTGASTADCSCAASKAKEILGPAKWKVAGDLLSGDRAKAETTIAKEGLGGMFGFLGQWASALGVAERQCGVRGLTRM